MPPKKSAAEKAEEDPDAAQATEEIPTADLTFKRLSTAKGHFTRVKNQLSDKLKEDPADIREREEGRSLFSTLEAKFDALQERFDDAELYSGDGAYDKDQDDLLAQFTRLSADYKVWSKGQPAAAAKNTSSEAKAFGAMMGYHFHARKIVGEKFDGTDLRLYPQFRIGWGLAEEHMTSLGYAGAIKLLELKKCLDKQALETIRQLPLQDGNYENAIKLLDESFKRPIKFAQLVVQDLLQAPTMGSDFNSITKGLQVIESAEQALLGLKLTKAQAGELVFNVLCESKLNNAMIREWSKTKDRMKDDDNPCGHRATLEDMKTVIRQHKLLVEDFDGRKAQQDNKNEDAAKKNDYKQKMKSTLAGSFTAQSPTGPNKATSCLLCDKTGQRAADCFKFTKARNPAERVKVLDSKPNLCRNCLKGTHSANDCRQPPGCQKCHRKHHSLLHMDRNSTATSMTSEATSRGAVPRQPQGAPTQPSTVAAATGNPLGRTPLLQTCRAWALAPSNEKFLATVFLDSGSELTMIRRDLAQKMGLDGPQHQLNLTGVGGIVLPPSTEKKVTFRLQSRAGDYVSPQITAVTKSQLTDTIRGAEVDPTAYPHLKDCVFADDYPRPPTMVDILIGIADFGNLLTGGVIRGQPHEPVALQTKLGLVLSGSA